MSHKSTRVICDSHLSDEPANTPLFAVHDSLTGTWYEMDADAWGDLVLQGNDPDDEFAYACPGCLRPLMYCSCPMEER